MITVWSYWSSPNKTNKTVGILVTQLYFRGNNGKRSCLQAAMLVFQTNPVEAELFSYVTFSIVTFSYEGRFRSSYWTKKKKGGGEGNTSPPPLPSPPPPPFFTLVQLFRRSRLETVVMQAILVCSSTLQLRRCLYLHTMNYNCMLWGNANFSLSLLSPTPIITQFFATFLNSASVMTFRIFTRNKNFK